jgi:hypothetical protein
MNRIKSALKYALPLAAVLMMSSFSLGSAQAYWEAMGSNEDGSATLYYNESTGVFAVVIEKNGKFGVYFEKGVVMAMLEKMGISNPDPNDPNNGQGTTKPDVADLLKHAHGVTWEVKADPEGTPLGGAINGNGGGKVPHWNPGGDDNGSGPGPHHDNTKGPQGTWDAKDKANIQGMLNEIARQVANAKGGMFDGSEGGTEGPPGLNKHGGTPKNYNNGQGHGDEDGDGKNDYYDPNLPDGEDLGPKPELVNPSPENKGGARNAGTPKTKNHGTVKVLKTKTDAKTETKTAKGSDVMSPGLLEGSGGFSTNGPAAAGALHGGGAATTRLR